jgi:hypothetical protein
MHASLHFCFFLALICLMQVSTHISSQRHFHENLAHVTFTERLVEWNLKFNCVSDCPVEGCKIENTPMLNSEFRCWACNNRTRSPPVVVDPMPLLVYPIQPALPFQHIICDSAAGLYLFLVYISLWFVWGAISFFQNRRLAKEAEYHCLNQNVPSLVYEPENCAYRHASVPVVGLPQLPNTLPHAMRKKEN